MYLLGVACKKVNDSEAAKDLVQEIFTTLVSKRDDLLEIVSLKAYLLTSLKYAVFNHYRKELVNRRYEEFAMNSNAQIDDSLLPSLHAKQIEEQLAIAVDKLPPQCGTVFKLSRQQHLSNAEIALQLNISENTVEQHMRKALRILRGSLGDYLEVSLILYCFIG